MHQCTPHKAHDSSSANGSNRIAAKQIWRVTLSWLRGVSAKHINAHTRTHTHSDGAECLSPSVCLHAGNSVSWMGSLGSLPDITPPPPRPSPLLQQDNLLNNNNHLPVHNNVVSTLRFISHVNRSKQSIATTVTAVCLDL